jgi:hypothetical protein
MEKEFESRTFKYGFLEGNERSKFKEDISSLKENLNINKLKENSELIVEVIYSDEEERYKIYDKLIESEIIKNSEKILSFHRVAKYFFQKFLDESTKEENIETITKDISKALEIDESEFSFFNELLQLVKEETERYEQKSRKNRYQKGVFPYIKSVGTTVEIRGVFNREIDYEEDFDSYKERVQTDEENPLTPVISVSLSVDSGNPEKFYFQASQESLENLIKELNAALYKSKILEDKLKNK